MAKPVGRLFTVSFSSSSFSSISRLRNSGAGALFARGWHKFAPPLRVWKTIYGMKVCLDLRDSLIYWTQPAGRIEETEGFHRMLEHAHGSIWDVGCNIGVFSLYAARQGHSVIAFDISPKALRLLNESCQRNRLNVKAVQRAFALRSFCYDSPGSASPENRPSVDSASGAQTSITFKEAASAYGIPGFIKMDIEGAEKEFLESEEFKKWIVENKITMLVELHENRFWDLVWKDVPYTKFDVSHVLFRPV